MGNYRLSKEKLFQLQSFSSLVFSVWKELVVAGTSEGLECNLTLPVPTPPVVSLNHLFGKTFASTHSTNEVLIFEVTSQISQVLRVQAPETILKVSWWQEECLLVGSQGNLYQLELRTGKLKVFSQGLFEQGEFVQLSLWKSTLVVSSSTKSFLVSETQKLQVGTKPRKGTYGARAIYDLVYAGRPKGNLWEANAQGVVLKTSSFKFRGEPIRFGLLYQHKNFLVSWTGSLLCLVDPFSKALLLNEVFPPDTELFYNEAEAQVYAAVEGTVYRLNFIEEEEWFQKHSGSGSIDEIIEFLKTNSEFHSLRKLEVVCRRVFYYKETVSSENKAYFEALIEALENPQQNIPFQEPQKAAPSEPDMLQYLISTKVSPYHTAALKLTKKKLLRAYYFQSPKLTLQTYCFFRHYTKLLTKELALVYLLLLNSELDKVSYLLEVAKLSLDKETFFELKQLEKNLINTKFL